MDSERPGSGAAVKTGIGFCTSCTNVGTMRRGSERLGVSTASSDGSTAPNRKRRHWLRVRQAAVRGGEERVAEEAVQDEEGVATAMRAVYGESSGVDGVDGTDSEDDSSGGMDVQ